MALLENAIEYVLGMITENEEVKKFPKDFTTASMLWIRSWFLTDDPVNEKILSNPNKSSETKKDIIEGKLESLKDNIQFQKQLESQINEYLTYKENSVKNLVKNAIVDVEEDIHIGDESPSDSNFQVKNVVEGGHFKSKGGFHVGDKR